LEVREAVDPSIRDDSESLASLPVETGRKSAADEGKNLQKNAQHAVGNLRFSVRSSRKNIQPSSQEKAYSNMVHFDEQGFIQALLTN